MLTQATTALASTAPTLPGSYKDLSVELAWETRQASRQTIKSKVVGTVDRIGIMNRSAPYTNLPEGTKLYTYPETDMHKDLEFPSEKVNTSMLYLGQGQIEPESYTSNAEEEEAWQAVEKRMDIIGHNGATGEHYGEPVDDNCPAARVGQDASVPEWTDINLRQPDEYQVVLWFCQGGNIRTGMYYGKNHCDRVPETHPISGKGRPHYGKFGRYAEPAESGYIATHWMPLPQPPEQEQGE